MPLPASVSLALGGGGARGYFHVGAIQELEARGIRIAGIAGTSMGALVGGIYAAGGLEEFAAWARTLNQTEVLRLLDVSLLAPGVIRAERVIARVREIVGDARIEEFEVPFTAVATDLLSRREVWFQRGRLDVAIRASIALPGILTPVMLNGQLLADGGLMDPVPVAPIAAVPAEMTIAISLGGERIGSAVHATAEPRPLDEWLGRFRRGAAHALESELVRSVRSRWSANHGEATEVAQIPAPPPLGDELPADLRRFDVMSQALDTMQALVSRYRMAGYPPDQLIEVPRDACGTLDFHRATELIELGRKMTAERLDQLAQKPAGDVEAQAPPL
jgi:NTE family protein